MNLSESSAASSKEKARVFGNYEMDKIEKYKWAAQDKPGIPTEINKSKLLIDPSYQRTISNVRVLALAANWSWLACGCLQVAQRPDGSLFVIDGQHRLEAAMRRSDISTLPCLVFQLADVPAEALAFFRANCNRKPISSYDRFMALLRAEDPVAIDVLRLLQSQGYEPSKNERDGGVRCLAAVIAAFNVHRGALLKLWPLVAQLHENRPLSQRLFNGLLYIQIHSNDDLTAGPWPQRILEIGYTQLLDSINRSAAFYSTGGDKVFAQGLIERLNKGRRKKITLEKEVEEVA